MKKKIIILIKNYILPRALISMQVFGYTSLYIFVDICDIPEYDTSLNVN